MTGRWRIIALTLLGLFLLYHVVTKSFGAYLADANPEAALVLNRNNPNSSFEPRGRQTEQGCQLWVS